eukprot:gene17329-23637_t
MVWPDDETTNAILVVPSVLSDNLLIRPQCLGSDIDVHILAELRRKVEGGCTRHGYILENYTSICRISAVRLEDASMNGDVIFSVEYNALVCNPPVGLNITLRVSDNNMFAFFAQAGIQSSDGQFTPLLDAILVKDQHEGDLLEKLNAVSNGESVRAVILGKRFEIGDSHISVVARLLANDSDENDSDENDSDGDPTRPNNVCFTRVVDSVLPVASLSKLRINNELLERKVSDETDDAVEEDGVLFGNQDDDELGEDDADELDEDDVDELGEDDVDELDEADVDDIRN